MAFVSATFTIPFYEAEQVSFVELARLRDLALWYESREAIAEDPEAEVWDMIRRGVGRRKPS